MTSPAKTQQKRRKLPVNGWIVLNKPLGISSTQALGKVRWLFSAAKGGHGGTLDPLASGLLPIALGEATKTIQWAMDGRKTYHFTVRWGAETTTDDLEGDINATSPHVASQHDIVAILAQFTGAVQQRPPAYSAIKVDGERAYDLARAGELVELDSRIVNIESLQIVSHAWPETLFEVSCGKGTYVRSLARDMGRVLGCLGHVVTLRRTRVGPFDENDMISLEKLEEMGHRPASENSLSALLRPIETVLVGIPAQAVMDLDAHRLKQGQTVLLSGSSLPAECEVVLVTHGGKPLGLCSFEHGALKPKRLFNL